MPKVCHRIYVESDKPNTESNFIIKLNGVAKNAQVVIESFDVTNVNAGIAGDLGFSTVKIISSTFHQPNSYDTVNNSTSQVLGTVVLTPQTVAGVDRKVGYMRNVNTNSVGISINNFNMNNFNLNIKLLRGDNTPFTFPALSTYKMTLIIIDHESELNY